MRPDIKRSIKSSQPKLREINLKFLGTPATPSVDGFDKLGIKQVVDNGVGDYTIIFKYPFERDCMLKSFGMITAAATLFVTAVAYDRITINTFAMDGITPKEADFYLTVLGSDGRLDY